jgi:hypothetical protein
MTWLGGLYNAEDTRAQFAVQVFLPEGAIVALKKIEDRFPGVTNSTIVRALFAIYSDRVTTREPLNRAVEDLIKMDEYRHLSEGTRSRVHVRFKPASFEDLHGLAEAFDMSPAKIVENAVIRMLAVLEWGDSAHDGQIEEGSVVELKNVNATVEITLKAA